MMKKIKKFRIQPRASFVLKGLKALASTAQVTPELEQAVESEVSRAQEHFLTAAMYKTFGLDELPEWAASLAPPREKGVTPVALTFFAATIGVGIEGELGDALSRGEGLRSQILTSLGEESAEQAVNFVQRLVAEEAKEESCELSGRTAASEMDLQRNILSALEADKIDIRMDNVGHLSPRFSRTGFFIWWPSSRQKK
jgi:hypothetical protein